ncbi:MAG: hypothetical protein R2877_02300 [Bdellovibrionota bacterium]
MVVLVQMSKGREEILKVHAKKIPMEEAVDLSILARGTVGFSRS